MTHHPYRGRSVLITGGLGFIGSNLARRLVELGDVEVSIVDALLPDQGGNWCNLDGLDDCVKLRHSERWTQRRRNLAVTYLTALQATTLQLPRITNGHAVHLFVVRHRDRDALRTQLQTCGIETVLHYPYLLHQQPLFQRAEQPALPIAEQVVKEIFSLPLNPQFSDEEIGFVIAALRKMI